MDMEKIAMTAQKISFEFEDNYYDTEKRKLFAAFFEKYLAEVDPEAALEPYDAITALGRKNSDAFDHMIKEMVEAGLITE
jgi:hypothetical protein